MTDIITTILPGPAQNIAAALASGFTIRNQSTTTAVWISGNPNVSPGNGMKLSALGSLSWSGGPCYAVLDSATGQATLSLSTSSSAVTDPVAIAQAVAAQGVPNVLTGSSVTVIGGRWQVGSFASLSINFLTSGIGTLKISFFPPNNSNPVYTETYTIGNGINGFLLITNVYGGEMEITGTGGTLSITNLVVYGSNRAIPRDKLVPSTLMLNAGITQPWAANTQYVLQSIVTPGGKASLNFRATALLITGTAATSWGFYYFDSVSNSIVFQNIVNNKAFVQDGVGNYGWTGEFYLPPGVIQFAVSNDGAATANATAVMTGTLPN